MKLKDAIALINEPGLGAVTNPRWADLGCGDGLFTYALANVLHAGATITAVDKAKIVLKALPNQHNTAIVTKQMDFTKGRLDIGIMDGIIMANSLHFVADKITFLHSLKNQLTTRGIFLIIEYLY